MSATRHKLPTWPERKRPSRSALRPPLSKLRTQYPVGAPPLFAVRSAAGHTWDIDGVTLSLSHPIEAEVAERLIALVPCAAKVRFTTNGSNSPNALTREAII